MNTGSHWNQCTSLFHAPKGAIIKELGEEKCHLNFIGEWAINRYSMFNFQIHYNKHTSIDLYYIIKYYLNAIINFFFIYGY